MVKLHYNITVTGKVQGVFFRANTKGEAKKYGLKGYVKNRVDGSVYIEAEGEKEALDRLAAWCKLGPEMAEVDEVSIVEGAVVGYSQFEIRRF